MALGLDGVFGTGVRPDGLLVAVILTLLAGWVVLCAGGGASLVDGAGRQLIVAVACGGTFQLSYPLGDAVLVFGLPKARK